MLILIRILLVYIYFLKIPKFNYYKWLRYVPKKINLINNLWKQNIYTYYKCDINKHVFGNILYKIFILSFFGIFWGPFVAYSKSLRWSLYCLLSFILAVSSTWFKSLFTRSSPHCHGLPLGRDLFGLYIISPRHNPWVSTCDNNIFRLDWSLSFSYYIKLISSYLFLLKLEGFWN